jgi:hypothetical protein
MISIVRANIGCLTEYPEAYRPKPTCSGKVTVKKLVVPQSSKTLDAIEFGEYVEQLRSWAREFLNIEIPDPEKVRI